MRCECCGSEALTFDKRRDWDDRRIYWWEAYCSDCQHVERIPEAVAVWFLERKSRYTY